MTPEVFKQQLQSLPPNTPITAEHILAILSVLSPSNVQPSDQAYSTWDSGKLINQKVLAEWIGESESTIEKWRKLQKGPIATYKGKKVIYEVGAVRDWLKSNTHKSTAEHRQSKNDEIAKSMGLSNFGSIEYDSVFATIYINDIATPFFETIRDNEEDYLEMEFTGYQVVWTEKDSFASVLLSGYELKIEAEKIVDEILRIVDTGTPINKLQTVLINNQAHSINLTHLIALNTYEFDQYTLLIKDLYNAGLDFHLKDNHNQTSLDIANTNNNSHLVNMINSFDLHKKLRGELVRLPT